VTVADQFGNDLTQTANADLSAAGTQYKIVKIVSLGKVDLTSAATDKPLGVLQNRPIAGQAAEVRVDGTTKCVCGAAVTAGQEIMSDASGRGITATTTNEVVGIAVTSTANANELFDLLIRPYHKV